MRDLKAIGAVVIVAVLTCLIVGAAIWSVSHNRRVVIKHLENQGYEAVQLSTAWWNRAPIQCAGKHTSIYTYQAQIGGRDVTGFACYQGWPWEAKNWDD